MKCVSLTVNYLANTQGVADVDWLASRAPKGEVNIYNATTTHIHNIQVTYFTVNTLANTQGAAEV